MKTSNTCPKCNTKPVYHTDCVMDRGEGNVATCFTLKRSGPIEARDIGRFEAYVCPKCGFTEFYVEDPGEIRRLME